MGRGLDVTGWQLGGQFHQVTSGGFLLLLLECGKSKTCLYSMIPRATPHTIGNYKFNH
jgi:hypothetical protein